MYVAILFAIPPLLQLPGIALIRSRKLGVFYTLVALLSSGSYLTCWMYYSTTATVPEFISWLCLSFTGVLMLIAFLIATAMFKTKFIFKKLTHASDLAAEIGTSPVGEILFFLAFFISIAYLIAFSLAFSDRYRTTHEMLPGLRSDTNIDSEEYERRPGDWTNDAPTRKWSVVFRSGSAVIDLESLRDNSLTASEVETRLRNSQAIDRIVEYLVRLHDRVIRVTLIGRSDEAAIVRSSQYGSQYELAQARAQAVKIAVQNQLYDGRGPLPSIEWLIVPLSESPEVTPGDRRSVEVSVQPINQVSPADLVTAQSQESARLLKLIEYVYFAVYTISTTGYGDLKPATSYVKFVCVLSNFYAIFFLVIFFNVLLSPKRRKRRRLGT